MVSRVKHAHYLLGVGDKVREVSRMEACDSYRNQGCDKQETWTSNLLNTENQWVLSAVVMVVFKVNIKKWEYFESRVKG